MASDIPKNGYFLPPENLHTQRSLKLITQRTEENQMLLNKKKSKTMNFNFTNDFKFSSRLEMQGEIIETINETKLLGVLILGLQYSIHSEESKCQNEDTPQARGV